MTGASYSRGGMDINNGFVGPTLRSVRPPMGRMGPRLVGAFRPPQEQVTCKSLLLTPAGVPGLARR
jgi:hypothetical protein